MCPPLTRRQVLRHAALVAATFPAAEMSTGWSLAEQAVSGPAVPMHLELVTVTDTEAAVTWFTGDPTRPDEYGRPAPVAAHGRVLLGTSPDPRTWEEVGAHGPTPYHYVEVAGLRPGTRYYVRAESNGVPATRTTYEPENPALDGTVAFTTLRPPPGRLLGRVAWLNDVHIGEHVSGLAYSDDRLPGGGFPPGFPADPENPYWRFMARSAVAEAAARGCTLMLVNGDLTDAARPADVGEARTILDAFGGLGGGVRLPDGSWRVAPGGARSYFVTRGNHDRAYSGAEHTGCTPVPSHPGLHDCFLDGFAAGFQRGAARFSVAFGDDRARYRFVGLDSCDVATGQGRLPDGELDFLRAELDKGDPTIPLFHHPAGDLAIMTAFPPGTFGVPLEDSARFQRLVAGYDNVAAVYHGHTHRNERTRATETGDVPYFEGGAVKEYPGGYTVVTLYQGGYMVNFWRTRDPEALAWSERSRGEYLGLYPYYTLGGVSDRNWVHDVRARITTPAPAPDVNVRLDGRTRGRT